MKRLFDKGKIHGLWKKGDKEPDFKDTALEKAITRVGRAFYLIEQNGAVGVCCDGSAVFGKDGSGSETGCYPLLAHVPALGPEDLGDKDFKKRFGLKYAYITGAMANGIASVAMVKSSGNAGMLGFFGAGGLSIDKIENAIDEIQTEMGGLPFGFNLIHSPGDPGHEEATVNLYLRKRIRLVSAAAYMKLTPYLVHYRLKGIHRGDNNRIICPNKIIAKISRIEVARQFFAPPPEKLLKKLVTEKKLTEEEAELGRLVPVADTMTAEADSGGHTDNRPALALFPTILALRNKMEEKYNFQDPLYVGLGGGISTPESAAAAFAMGAAYILTGSVNQACVEAGTSDQVRQMLAQAGQADVTMAPSADMFQMGVKVQVLKRGTMFSNRASKLYNIYSTYDSFEEVPEKEKKNIEEKILRNKFNLEWESTREFFKDRDPLQIKRAEENSKYKMALVFRSYLGQASLWAVRGEPTRAIDYQIWCGPAMGAFNEWAKGSFLENYEKRSVPLVAMNILFGASVATRAGWLRNQGISIPRGCSKTKPMELQEILYLAGAK